MQKKKINLFDLTYPELEETLKAKKQTAFRAQQITDWLYKKLVFEPNLMLNIPQSLKDVLRDKYSLYLPKIHDVSHSKSDNSYKFLLKTEDGKLIESILMIVDKRVTVCVSCMIGCPLACKFCATGSEIDFGRKLTPGEIIGQVLVTLKYAQEHNYAQRITNVVFMGMGEPFLNLKSVEKSIQLLTNPKGFDLSSSKISVSTAGVGRGIANFVKRTGVRIAVSLHFPTNELRSQYMPINEKFPLEELIAELKRVTLKKRDYILIEYLLLQGVNDTLVHAKQLFKLICTFKVKVNLIPYNPTKTLAAKASSEETITKFAKYLQDKGIFTSIRRSKGTDVSGGCGQFALKKQALSK